jgi:RNA polymerase sigma-70 factor (ECF subfamily)
MDSRTRFEAIFRAYAGAVRTYASRRAGPELGDDVVADVFVVVWRRLDEVPDDALPWLFAVARRVLANKRRALSRETALTARIASEQLTRPRSDSLTDERAAAVLEALARLSDRDREVLLLIAWEGLTPARAALTLEIAPNTCSARLSRARRRFQVELDAITHRSVDQRSPTKAEVQR